MARTMNRLSARAVSTLTKPGIYADGAGLYLRIQGSTSRSWVYIWHASGKRRETGLGAPPSVGLARARERAQQARDIIADGGDPISSKRARKTTPTFGEAADAFIEDRKTTVRSDKSIARWKRAIGEGGYADRLRGLRVDKIDTEDVLAVLRPLWESLPESAGTLRGYIEAVLNVAKVSGHRTGDNPAAWTGHLALILPARQRLSRGHHAAMPFDQVPDHMAKLKSQAPLSARALEFTILTACRTSEVLKARWDEFDLERAVWTIPASRMKAAKEHRVPLSSTARQLLLDIGPGDGFVFAGRSGDRPLSNMAMDMVLRRMEVDVTVHGFRSSFRDWAGEMTTTPREVAEAALAHTVGNSAEQAYRRGDALEKRRVLMETWARFCCSGSIANDKTSTECADQAIAAEQPH